MSSRYKIVNANKCQVGLDGKLHDTDEGGGISEVPQATETVLGGIKASNLPPTTPETNLGPVYIEPESATLYAQLGQINNLTAQFVEANGMPPKAQVYSGLPPQNKILSIYLPTSATYDKTFVTDVALTNGLDPVFDKPVVEHDPNIEGYFRYKIALKTPKIADAFYSKTVNANNVVRKLHSGTLEMWGVINTGNLTFTADGPVFKATYTLNFPEASLTDVFITISAMNDNGIWAILNGTGDNKSNIGITLFRTGSGTLSTDIMFRISGTWK